MDNVLKIFAERLKELREEKGINQKKLAQEFTWDGYEPVYHKPKGNLLRHYHVAPD